jgi:hypothetical protein
VDRDTSLTSLKKDDRGDDQENKSQQHHKTKHAKKRVAILPGISETRWYACRNTGKNQK